MIFVQVELGTGVTALDKISLCTETISVNTVYLAIFCTIKAEAQVVVAVARLVPVAIRRTHIRRAVVPAAPALHPVLALLAVILRGAKALIAIAVAFAYWHAVYVRSYFALIYLKLPYLFYHIDMHVHTYVFYDENVARCAGLGV